MTKQTEAEKRLFERLKAQQGKKKVEPEPIKEEELFKTNSGDVGCSPKQELFSKLLGYEPPSGRDHAITLYKKTDFSKGMQLHIPDMKEFTNYKPQQKEVEDLLAAWEMGDRTNIVGPTGSGKSSMVKYCCALTGRPFIRINGRGDMESSSLLGMMTVDEKGTKWVDGAVTEAVREGAVLCIDEWTLIPPDIMMTLQWLMEDGG